MRYRFAESRDFTQSMWNGSCFKLFTDGSLIWPHIWVSIRLVTPISCFTYVQVTLLRHLYTGLMVFVIVDEGLLMVHIVYSSSIWLWACNRTLRTELISKNTKPSCTSVFSYLIRRLMDDILNNCWGEVVIEILRAQSMPTGLEFMLHSKICLLSGQNLVDCAVFNFAYQNQRLFLFGFNLFFWCVLSCKL